MALSPARRTQALALALAACALVSRCASLRTPPAPAPTASADEPLRRPNPVRVRRVADAEALFSVRVSDETEYADGGGLDGGYSMRVSDTSWTSDAGPRRAGLDAGEDAAAPLGVGPDAGVESAEVSWLLAHIADGADAANPSDGPNVRALAARGPDGVRATASIFRAGDVARVPFARRVLERVALRMCRARPRRAAGDVLHWVELGLPTRRVPDGSNTFTWERGAAVLWPRDAMERLAQWADDGAQCRTPPPRPDAGAPSDAAPSDAAPNDAVASDAAPDA